MSTHSPFWFLKDFLIFTILCSNPCKKLSILQAAKGYL